MERKAKELDPLADPEGTTEAINRALADTVTTPTAEMPPDTLVKLPGGLVRGEVVITTGRGTRADRRARGGTGSCFSCPAG